MNEMCSYITLATDSRFEILQWLKAPSSKKNFRDARDKKEPGTGNWLLDDDRFIQWKENGKLLWLQGKGKRSIQLNPAISDCSTAGAGKTFLW